MKVVGAYAAAVLVGWMSAAEAFAGESVVTFPTDATPKENAACLQAAIDRMSAAGGGRVTVPRGTWTCGTLWLKSGVELHLAEGAVLQASADHDDYNALDAYPENWGCPTTEYWDGRHFIICYRQSNVSITGPGEINGNGEAFFDPEPIRYLEGMKPDACAWWNGIRWAKDKKRLRPGQLVVFVFCRDICVRNLTIRNSPCWCLFLAACENVSVSDYTARCGMNDGNTDGIDIDCCRHVRVENIDIDVGDDAVAIRASGHRLGDPDLVCEDVRIRKARLSSTSSVFRIGVGQGTIRNVTVEDVVCGRGGTAVTMAACYGDPKKSGVDMEDIVFRRCDFFCSRYGYKVRTGGAKMKFGIRRITFENCDFGTGGRFIGADPGCPLEPEDVRIVQ